MATLTGASATNVALSTPGTPNNCAAMQGNSPPAVAAPTGGLSGTLTLINVASGQDFTVNAEALSDLGTRAFYRPPVDPYPDFNCAEIDPVSVVAANGFVYRSTWTRAADAVSAVLMRRQAFAEYVLDTGTRSQTDVVLTFPTRHHFVNAAAASAPFSSAASWSANCMGSGSALFGERFIVSFFNRESSGGELPPDFGTRPPPPVACAAASVFTIANAQAHTAEGVLGSASRGVYPGSSAGLPVSTFQKAGSASRLRPRRRSPASRPRPASTSRPAPRQPGRMSSRACR